MAFDGRNAWDALDDPTGARRTPTRYPPPMIRVGFDASPLARPHPPGVQRVVAETLRALEARGSELLSARVGIAAGPLVQGTMGSSVKFEYTVIGDVVNTAARLEGQASANHLVVSAAVFDCLNDGGAIPGLPVDRRRIRVKGKAEPLEIVEILPLDGPTP